MKDLPGNLKNSAAPVPLSRREQQRRIREAVQWLRIFDWFNHINPNALHQA